MSTDLTAGIVRILKPDGTTAGTGFVVSDEGLIAACSHFAQVEQCLRQEGPRDDQALCLQSEFSIRAVRSKSIEPPMGMANFAPIRPALHSGRGASIEELTAPEELAADARNEISRGEQHGFYCASERSGQ